MIMIAGRDSRASTPDGSGGSGCIDVCGVEGQAGLVLVEWREGGVRHLHLAAPLLCSCFSSTLDSMGVVGRGWWRGGRMDTLNASRLVQIVRNKYSGPHTLDSAPTCTSQTLQ